jgi:energy-coupling factor transporter transmembrane protein EcfT
MKQYSHTQPGKLIGWIMIGAMLLFVMALAGAKIWTHPIYIQLIPYISLLLLMACWVLFYSLTVDITATKMTVSFGPGFIKKIFNLHEIKSAKAVRTKWYYGWGIRLTPHGWMYNVSGFDAVELELRGGKKFLVGTNEPEKLVNAIRSATGRHG